MKIYNCKVIIQDQTRIDILLYSDEKFVKSDMKINIKDWAIEDSKNKTIEMLEPFYISSDKNRWSLENDLSIKEVSDCVDVANCKYGLVFHDDKQEPFITIGLTDNSFTVIKALNLFEYVEVESE